MVAKGQIFFYERIQNHICKYPFWEVELNSPLLECGPDLQRTGYGNRPIVTLRWRNSTQHLNHTTKVRITGHVGT